MINEDIYFDKNYGKLYEKIEKGNSEIFKMQTENGVIINQYIKREIPIKINNTKYYDIITPYGYGGPYILKCNNKAKLLTEYLEAFGKYCLKNNIVSEFVRFHPIYKNYLDFKDIYNAKFNRYTLATNIKDYEDPVSSEFSKHCKKTIRQVLKEGISFRMIEHPTWNDMEDFIRIYYLNMERKEADEYYFFDKEYFKNILNYFKNKIIIAESIYKGKIIAAGLYFITAGNIHAHLSGTDTQYLNLSPAYILKYGTAKWAKEHGYNFIHYGGGTDTSEDNPLYLFKCKFAVHTKFEFWIGTKIWNKEIYNQLCDQSGQEQTDFFPAYRKR